MDQFILFGDSITQQAFSPFGHPLGAALTDAYIRKLDIVNRGFSGYNTSQALSLLPHVFPSPSQARVRFFTIFFGANDARLPNTPGGPQQHVPLATFKENLRAIATHPCVRAHEGIRIILVTPPALDERMLEIADEEKYGVRTPRRTAATTRRYADAVRELGGELRVPVLDLWRAMALPRQTASDAGGEVGSKDAPVNEALRGLLRDGLHFSEAGYAVLYQALMRIIETTWPDQMPEKLAFAFPAWDDEREWGADGGKESSRI